MDSIISKLGTCRLMSAVGGSIGYILQLYSTVVSPLWYPYRVGGPTVCNSQWAYHPHVP